MHDKVDIPHSKMKVALAAVLKEEGYISNYKVITDGDKKNIRVYLKYVGKEKVIKGIKRISKPGRRVYSSAEDMPRVLSGLGIAVVSTSNGLVTDRVARKTNIGGEVLCYVW
jgi:small subunit ribosomal protein S8